MALCQFGDIHDYYLKIGKQTFFQYNKNPKFFYGADETFTLLHQKI